MELLLSSQQERFRIQVYSEYLKKIPQLLQQLEVVETMYEKALMEEAMLQQNIPENFSREQYALRLARTKEQCIQRAADIRQQCRLIMALKADIEKESIVLRTLSE